MPPTLADRVQHMLEAIEDCENILRAKNRRAFATDRLTRLAVERALEIISEASRHIPKELKEREATIAWRPPRGSSVSPGSSQRESPVQGERDRVGDHDLFEGRLAQPFDRAV